MSRLTHLDEEGRARMVDVSGKEPTQRTARANGVLRCAQQTIERVLAGNAPKGSVVRTAELAGIMGAKRTSDLVPLCHPLSLSKVDVSVVPDQALPGFRIAAEVRTFGATGVEMEALTAVSIASLTLFDMLKAIDRTMTIGEIAVSSKTGGKSGDWQRSDR